MSKFKTTINQDTLLDYLKNNFSKSVADLQAITGGEGSQAYSFSDRHKKYVVRVNKHHTLGFKKDEYAYKNFSKYEILIPKIFKIGKFDTTNRYCISEFSMGNSLNSSEIADIESLKQELFNTLDKIHAVDVSIAVGFGKWDENGVGTSNTWKDGIISVDEYIKEGEENNSLFDTTFLEKEVWDKLYNELTELTKYCPDEKYLVHGDYGNSNIIIDKNKITGVIDWEASMYGDFLFDVAWLGFWSKSAGYIESYRKHSEKNKKTIKYFDERILCYSLYIGLKSLSFFAYSDQREKYEKLKMRINNL